MRWSAALAFLAAIGCAGGSPPEQEPILLERVPEPTGPVAACPQDPPLGLCAAVVQPVCGLPSADARRDEGRTYTNRCLACEEPSVKATVAGKCRLLVFNPAARAVPLDSVTVTPAPEAPRE